MRICEQLTLFPKLMCYFDEDTQCYTLERPQGSAGIYYLDYNGPEYTAIRKHIRSESKEVLYID